jgi:hypothetical protein
MYRFLAKMKIWRRPEMFGKRDVTDAVKGVSGNHQTFLNVVVTT